MKKIILLTLTTSLFLACSKDKEEVPKILQTLTTNNILASGISHNTATGGGIVTSNGGFPITEKGLCYSEKTNPTIGDAHTKTSYTQDAFSVTMQLLTPDTKYYVRAYATNSAGTAYGNEVSFTTLPTPTSLYIGQLYQGGKIAYISNATAGSEHGIIAAFNDINPGGIASSDIAITQCNNYLGEGYKDWRLPSQVELNHLYQNRNAIGNFNTDKYYWSSGPTGNSQNFSNGNITSAYISASTTPYLVRPVRVF